MSSEPATLEGYISTFRLRSATRSEVEWWGSIVLREPTFDFFIVLFEPEATEPNVGRSSLFAWHESGDLRIRRTEYTNRPQLEDDGLAIVIPNQDKRFLGGVPFKTLPDSMIEAFLDDWHRSKILTAFSDDKRRRKVLPWLQANGLGVYRQLEKAGRRTLELAVFPPKLDFLDEAEVQRQD
jgi:hypothetical protein